MKLLWFFPVAVLVGIGGTHTALRMRHTPRGRRRDRSWGLVLVLAWFPLFCWMMSQAVMQYP